MEHGHLLNGDRNGESIYPFKKTIYGNRLRYFPELNQHKNNPNIPKKGPF
jgi:hypothetical protein